MPTAKKPAAAPKDTNKIDLSQLTDLAKWLESTGLEEVEVEAAGTRIRLKKQGSGVPVTYAAPVASLAAPAPAAAQPAAESTANAFKSPMVGTFYRASSPDAAPFVKEGDTVSAGQPLAIIEAMKTMNTIESDRSGTVTKVLVSNAQAVEFGQPLFIIQ